MKKLDFILIGLLLVIIVVGVLSTKGNEEKLVVEYPVKLAGSIGLNEITYSEYEQMVNNGDAFVVVVERDGCYYCQQYVTYQNLFAYVLLVQFLYLFL